ALMNTTDGLSDLLGRATGVEEGDQVRDGSAVLTAYTASVPGSVVSTIIPSAQQDASFAAELTIDDDGRLVEATMTGPFYPATDEVTYSVRFVESHPEQESAGPGVAPGVAERWLLSVAAVAVAFAAADTYVVVLALPDMMRGAGLSIDELQRAAPIVSGFLLGYVAMLPLIGRIADLRGRLPVLVASLVIFAFGSLVTAAAYDLPSMVVGRFFQGVGAGGLVPATLALVAALYPP